MRFMSKPSRALAERFMQALAQNSGGVFTARGTQATYDLPMNAERYLRAAGWNSGTIDVWARADGSWALAIDPIRRTVTLHSVGWVNVTAYEVIPGIVADDDSGIAAYYVMPKSEIARHLGKAGATDLIKDGAHYSAIRTIRGLRMRVTVCDDPKGRMYRGRAVNRVRISALDLIDTI